MGEAFTARRPPAQVQGSRERVGGGGVDQCEQAAPPRHRRKTRLGGGQLVRPQLAW